MLRRIHVRNFKSLRDLEFKPGLTNVFVGSNASGKSNLLDVLKFLAAISRVGLSQALNQRLGFADVVWNGNPAAGEIAFEIEIDLPTRLLYRFEISGNPAGTAVVTAETLRGSQGQLLLDVKQGSGTAFDERGRGTVFNTNNPNALAALETNVPNWIGTELRQAIQQWRFYDLVPQTMKNVRQFSGAVPLSETGDNLADFLLQLKARHSAEFAQLERAVADCFPTLREIVPDPGPNGQVMLSSREKTLRRPIPIWNMAHGQLAFIALAALICAPPEMGASLFAIEEPESHLHPKLIEQLVEMLFARQAELAASVEGRPAQLFLTTHSPLVVNRVPPDSLWIVTKTEGGETEVQKAQEIAQIASTLDSAGFGDLVFSGAFERPAPNA